MTASDPAEEAKRPALESDLLYPAEEEANEFTEEVALLLILRYPGFHLRSLDSVHTSLRLGSKHQRRGDKRGMSFLRMAIWRRR
jgi:hypothetical protein